MATEPTYYPERARNSITWLRNVKNRMSAALAKRGWPFDETTDLTTIADAVEKMAIDPLGDFVCNVAVTINKLPNSYVPDAEKEKALLEGATVTFVAGAEAKTVPLESLQPGTVVSSGFLLQMPVPALIRINLNTAALRGTGINVPEIRTQMSAGVWGFDMALFKSAPKAYSEIGFRIFEDMSFSEVQDLIVDVDEHGVVNEVDTGYLDASTGKWVTTSPIERAIPQFERDTGALIGWNGYREHKRNDLFGYAAENEIKPTGYWPFNACKDHEWKAEDDTGAVVINTLVGIGDNGVDTPHWWVKKVSTSAPLKTRNKDGSWTSSTQRVTEYYFSETQLEGYELVEIDYIGKYKSSRANYTVKGERVPVEYSAVSNKWSPDNGTRRDTQQYNTERNNDLVNATFDGVPVKQYPYQMGMYSFRDHCRLLPLIVMACGTRNVQDYIWGWCSPFADTYPDSSADRWLGVTNTIAKAGYDLGTFRLPNVAGCFQIFGIEDLWGNVGTFFPDITNVEGTFWYQPDRAKYWNDMTPIETEGVLVSGKELLKSKGYRPLSPKPIGGWIRALESDANDPMLLVSVAPKTTSLPSSSETCYGDYQWLGTAKDTSYLVTSGYFRNNGASLGPFCVHAGDGWSYAFGRYWSGRVSFRKLSTRAQAGGQAK